MLKHVVCQKIPDQAAAQKAKEMLLALPQEIPELIKMEVGLDTTHSERSFDLVLIATFATREDLHMYEVHPAHQKVRQFIRSVRTGTVSVDYEEE